MNKQIKIKKTDYLVPNNDFIVGLGSVLNLMGSYFEYDYSNSFQEADLKALKSDWDNIGEDINKSMKNLDNSVDKEEEDICLTF